MRPEKNIPLGLPFFCMLACACSLVFTSEPKKRDAGIDVTQDGDMETPPDLHDMPDPDVPREDPLDTPDPDPADPETADDDAPADSVDSSEPDGTTEVRIIHVSAGGSHTCAVTAAGAATCWGNNEYGRLGNGSTTDSPTPVGVTGLTSGVRAVAAGDDHTCALLDTGAVKCWGSNFKGQIGNGETGGNILTPADVSGLDSGVSAITAGGLHTCAVLDTGAAKCWGSNSLGKLGDGTTTDRPEPVDVSGLSSGVIAIDAGDGHTCSLLAGGAVKCWGDNFFGQIGDGTTTPGGRLTPVDVQGISSGAAAVAAGYLHSCALLDTGEARCWGSGSSGQLGQGARDDSPTPVAVSGLVSGESDIGAGDNHSCVLLGTGGVQCWGGGGYLGDGTINDSLTPVDVSGLSEGAAALTVGYYHSCALLDTGAVKCWGSNSHGQLGDGTTTDREAPVDVLF